MPTKTIRRPRQDCTCRPKRFVISRRPGARRDFTRSIEPRPGLPGGALIVDFIEGRAPRLPDELEAMADTLAQLHSLPLPAPGLADPAPGQSVPHDARRRGAGRSTLPRQGGHRAQRACRDRRGTRADAGHGGHAGEPLAAAIDRAGRHASRQLHRRSRRHCLVRRSRKGACRFAGDRSRARDASDIDRLASRCRQSPVASRGRRLLRVLSREDRQDTRR